VSKMARQFLGCPATSAGTERLFSGAGKMHSDLAAAMEAGTLQHMLMVGSNYELPKCDYDLSRIGK